MYSLHAVQAKLQLMVECVQPFNERLPLEVSFTSEGRAYRLGDAY
jgi:hypothetical protein